MCGTLILTSEKSMDKNYLLYINFDGFADFYYSDEQWRFPALKALVDDSVRFSSCYSSIPSITVPMQTAIVTGCTSARTGNCYQYYDKRTEKVVKTGRHLEAETVAELYRKMGRTVLSIQQFAVENYGCTRDDKDHLYIQPEKDFSLRFDILCDYYENLKVPGFEFESYRDLVLFYIDDLDSDGHNHHAPFARDESERVEKARRKLELIDGRIAELISLLKRKGLYEKTTILLTADHGMVGFQGKSYRKRLRDDLSALLGVDVSFSSGDVVIIGNTIQAQIYFNNGFSVDQNNLKNKLLSLDYVEKVLTKDELDALGIDPRYADLLVSPKEGYAFFSPDLSPSDIRFASHDSLSEKAQHVFALIHHPSLEPGLDERRVSIIDMIPTCLSLVGMPSLSDATGEVLL